MNDINILKLLCETVGVTGHEKNIAFNVKSIFEKYCNEVAVDKFFNVTGIMRAKLHNLKGRDKPIKVMYTAHTDEIGLLVTKIEAGGFIKIGKISGIDPKTLISKKVVISGKRGFIKGITASIPPHLTDAEERKKAPAFEDIYVDTGLSEEEVRERINIGDIVAYEPSFETQGMSMVSGKSLDDRIGIYTLYRTMQILKERSFGCDVFFHGGVSEEFDSLGAYSAAYKIEPDIAVVIDVTHGKAGIADINEENQTFLLGKGPVICKSPILSSSLTENLIGLCKVNGIKPAIEVDNKNTGTDALAVSVTGMGCPAALVSIPLKYMHSQVEMASLKDVEMTAEILAQFVMQNEFVLNSF